MGRCSSCGATVVWVKTRAGKAMPCDPELVDVYALSSDELASDGELSLVVGIDVAGDIVRGLAATPEAATAQIRISHFATCANAARHRKQRKAGSDG